LCSFDMIYLLKKEPSLIPGHLTGKSKALSDCWYISRSPCETSSSQWRSSDIISWQQLY